MNTKPLSRYKVFQICRCFSVELTATQTAKLIKVNRNTVNRYYRLFRQSIYQCQLELELQFVGEVELDESYFGGYRKGEKGRSTKSKVPVFGMLKRGGKVFTQVVPDVKAATLRRIIKQRISTGSTLYTDAFKSYDGLVLDGYEHIRINHSHELVSGKRHINGIESFWSYAKAKLSRYYGVRPQDFPLYLKEMEFRFNHRGEDVEKLVWKCYLRHQLSHSLHP